MTRATIRRAEAGTGESGPAVVRGVRGGRPVSVEFDVRTVYDFIISLSGESDPGELAPDDRRWLVAARERIAAEIGGATEWDASELGWGLAMLAIERPAIRTPREFVALAETVSSVVLARTMFCDELQDPALRPLVESALAGDTSTLESLSARIAEPDPEMRIDLLRRPDRYQRDVVAILRAWLPLFEEIEERVAAVVRRDADGRAGDIAAVPALQLIERVTGGVRWLPEPGVARVILAPSYFSRPYNYVLAGDGWRFFAYPVGDDALATGDPSAPPASLLRYHHALGDESRLRILHLLSERDHYLTELAQRLDLSKPTVKHHLAQLRSAGLVTVTEEGALMYWSLRRERIDEAGRELARFLA